ncbi:MAG: VapD family protein [Lachnospiraceae bacterium]
MERKYYKAINFDLIINNLKEYYDKANHLNAYNDIRIFLTSRGFEHRQESGYRSKEKLLDIEITAIVREMGKTFSWLYKCVGQFDVTNIGQNYSLIAILESEELELDEPT